MIVSSRTSKDKNIEIISSNQNSSITESSSTSKLRVPGDIEEYNQDVIDVIFDYLGLNQKDYTVLSCVKSYQMAKEIGYEMIYMVTLEDNIEKSQYAAFVDYDSMELVDFYRIAS